MMQFDGLLFFFLAICIGYFAVKARFVPESAADALPAVLINICYPAMVLQTFTSASAATFLETGLPVVAATLAVTFALFFGALLVFRRTAPERRALLRFITAIGNVNYVAIPLLSVFLSPEALFIALVHGAVQDFLIWSLYHQLFLGSGAENRRDVFKKMFTSPCLLAAVAGVLLVALDIRLPSFLRLTVDKISAATSPIALLFLGMLIHRYGLFSWRRDRAALLYSAAKVLMLPVLVYLALQFFLAPSVALLLAILFASPAPLTSVVWCKQYGGDVKRAVDCTLSSTLFFLLVMSPALLLFTQLGILS